MRGKEAIHNTIKKNHHGSPWEFTTDVNLWRLWYPKKLSKKVFPSINNSIKYQGKLIIKTIKSPGSTLNIFKIPRKLFWNKEKNKIVNPDKTKATGPLVKTAND